jgi:hypothetical protein
MRNHSADSRLAMQVRLAVASQAIGRQGYRSRARLSLKGKVIAQGGMDDTNFYADGVGVTG